MRGAGPLLQSGQDRAMGVARQFGWGERDWRRVEREVGWSVVDRSPGCTFHGFAMPQHRATETFVPVL